MTGLAEYVRFIAHMFKIQPIGRADGSAGGAIAGGQCFCHPLGRPSASAAALKRADQTAHLIVQKAARFDDESESLGPPDNRWVVISKTSKVLIGLFAWHMVERNVVKSWLPKRKAAPARMASTSSGCLDCQTKPASWVTGAARQTSRNR